MTRELTPEQWLAQQGAEVEQDELADERKAIEAIIPYADAKKAASLYEAEAKRLREPIDNWFLLHPDEPQLVDHERGRFVYFRSGGTEQVYDAVLAIKDKSPGLFERLLILGCLVVDGKAVQQAIKDGLLMAGDVQPFVHLREKTRALMVGEKK